MIEAFYPFIVCLIIFVATIIISLFMDNGIILFGFIFIGFGIVSLLFLVPAETQRDICRPYCVEKGYDFAGEDFHMSNDWTELYSCECGYNKEKVLYR